MSPRSGESLLVWLFSRPSLDPTTGRRSHVPGRAVTCLKGWAGTGVALLLDQIWSGFAVSGNVSLYAVPRLHYTRIHLGLGKELLTPSSKPADPKGDVRPLGPLVVAALNCGRAPSDQEGEETLGAGCICHVGTTVLALSLFFLLASQPEVGGR